MDCQCCRKRTARIRICDLDQNKVSTQFNVCSDCYNIIKLFLYDINKPLMDIADVITEVQDILQGKENVGDTNVSANKPTTKIVPACPDCGMTLTEFKAKGRFGCPNDYEIFSEHLDPLFERIHDIKPPQHHGHLPDSSKIDTTGVTEAKVEQRQNIGTLKEELDKAVIEEDYERAARLRDEIIELEAGQS
ncbi:MAG: UvrB/UvrC motif-containing protein [Planctomycetes bacterium]|nr:UvrB/UvrC motif-containing protein [Planctomycetota bacterium]